MSLQSSVRASLAGLVISLGLSAGSAFAQTSPWSSIAASSPQSVQLEQALLVVTQGNTVNAFSALTKTWTAITTVFGPPTNSLLNEHLVVRDGPVFYGYSPRNATFQAQFAFAPGATVVPSASPQTWHSIVIDGNHVHAFFAFTGQWITYAFSSPPTVTSAMNGRFCFLVSEGSNLYAVSSFYGTLVPAPAGAVSAGSFGNVAMATSTGMVHGFGASQNRWASMPVTSSPAIAAGNAQCAFVSVNDGAAISLFSGNTGTFTTLPAAATASANLERYAAVFVDASNAYGYSALLGTYATLPISGPVTVIKQQMFALVDDGTNLIAYSAAKGQFAAPIPKTGLSLLHKAQIAALMPGGSNVPAAVYSSYRNQWDSGPGIGSGTLYLTAVSAVVEESTGGLWGWSDRGPAWILEAAPPMEIAVAGTSPPNLAETFFARQGTMIYAFNPRTSAWRTATTTNPASLVRAHHCAILAQDGASVWGFNIWSDTWSGQSLQAAYLNGGGQVESGWATDGVRIFGYGGVGQLNTITEFPDLYRASTLGSLFRLEVNGEPNALALVAFAFGPASVPVPPYGTLLLDPATLAILAQAAIPAGGVFTLTLQIPNDPGLSGVTPHFQAGIYGPSGLYLTNSVFPTIY